MDLDLVLLKYHVQSHEKLWFSTDVLPWENMTTQHVNHFHLQIQEFLPSGKLT